MNTVHIRYAPLIHARTKLVDFNSSDFLVRPADFTAADIAWAKQLALDSTHHLESAGETGRRVVWGNGRFAVSALTIEIEALCRLCGRAPQYHRVDESQRRLAYAFIGVAVPLPCPAAAFDVPPERFLDLYWQNIAPVWQYVSTVTQTPGYAVEPFAQVQNLGANLGPLHGRVILPDDPTTRETIAAQVLQRALAGETIAFCSDLSVAKIQSQSAYNIVTTGHSVDRTSNEEPRPAYGGGSPRQRRTDYDDPPQVAQPEGYRPWTSDKKPAGDSLDGTVQRLRDTASPADRQGPDILRSLTSLFSRGREKTPPAAQGPNAPQNPLRSKTESLEQSLQRLQAKLPPETPQAGPWPGKRKPKR